VQAFAAIEISELTGLSLSARFVLLFAEALPKKFQGAEYAVYNRPQAEARA
jgi:hypothetical protein